MGREVNTIPTRVRSLPVPQKEGVEKGERTSATRIDAQTTENLQVMIFCCMDYSH